MCFPVTDRYEDLRPGWDIHSVDEIVHIRLLFWGVLLTFSGSLPGWTDALVNEPI